MKSLRLTVSLTAAVIAGVIVASQVPGNRGEPNGTSVHRAQTRWSATKVAFRGPAEPFQEAHESKPAAKLPIDKAANAPIKAGDWPQWAGTSYRNNTPVGENIPVQWDVGKFDRKTGKWLGDGAENIKWVTQVGSQTYGNPVVSRGKLFVGTNNGAGYLPRYPSRVDLGCLLCFRESDGAFLWQDSNEKLPTGRVHDWPLQGVCAAPLVEGNRVWYVTNRGEVVCLDAEGFYDDEDDGPLQNELGRLFDLRRSAEPAADLVGPAISGLNDGRLTDALIQKMAEAGFELTGKAKVTAAEPGAKWSVQARVGGADRDCRIELRGPVLSAFKVISPADKHEADSVWRFNMMDKLRVSQHNMCACSVTSLGDILFVNTSNGVDESHINIPSPDAPSFMAMDKRTGEVLWTNKSPAVNILHGQWSSPTVGVIHGVPQVIFGGGDGWVYSFRADAGKDGKPVLLWKFDANPKTSKWILGGAGTRNNIIATPVICDGLVYVAVGQDPEHGEGIGHLWCINPNLRGDVSPQFAVKANDHSQILPPRRLQSVISEQGEATIDNPNSAALWEYSRFDSNGDGEYDFEEEMHRSCGTVAIKNDLLFISDFSGLFHCLDAKTGKVHWTYDMLAAAWGSPLIVENHVYIGDEDGDVCVFNLSADPHEPIAEINMGNSVYSTPIVANGILYIANRTHVFAIEAK